MAWRRVESSTTARVAENRRAVTGDHRATRQHVCEADWTGGLVNPQPTTQGPTHLSSTTAWMSACSAALRDSLWAASKAHSERGRGVRGVPRARFWRTERGSSALEKSSGGGWGQGWGEVVVVVVVAVVVAVLVVGEWMRGDRGKTFVWRLTAVEDRLYEVVY